MNLISKSEVFAENKLFATLDTTVRKVVFDNLPFLLSDTVGFIRKLPTELIDRSNRRWTRFAKPTCWFMWWTFRTRSSRSRSPW